MALSVLTSWLKSVQIRCISILATITNITIALIISKQLLGFWNPKDLLLPRTLTKTELLYGQTLLVDIMTNKRSNFVGATIDVNCNELNSCDIVTKKNTQTRNLDVFEAVCYNAKRPLIILMVADRIYLCNKFAVCYG